MGRRGVFSSLSRNLKKKKNGAKDLAIKLNKAIKLHKFSTYPHSVTISVGVAFVV